MGRLAGKVALISGTGRGMGRAAALEFTAQGGSVFGCDLDEASSAETVGLVKEAGGLMAAVAPVDLGTPDGARAGIVDQAVHGDVPAAQIFGEAGPVRLAAHI